MELLEKLCKASGISGFENEIQEIMKKELSKSCDEVEIDNFGNVIAKKGNGKKKIMLAAHMDEIGLMVKHITKDGFLNFVKFGGRSSSEDEMNEVIRKIFFIVKCIEEEKKSVEP